MQGSSLYRASLASYSAMFTISAPHLWCALCEMR